MNITKYKEKDSIGGYQLLEKLGAGATARVYRVREPDGGKEYALKCSTHTYKLTAEGAVLKQLRHSCFPRWIAEGREAAGMCMCPKNRAPSQTPTPSSISSQKCSSVFM